MPLGLLHGSPYSDKRNMLHGHAHPGRAWLSHLAPCARFLFEVSGECRECAQVVSVLSPSIKQIRTKSTNGE
jgi:hypothetical protein